MTVVRKAGRERRAVVEDKFGGCGAGFNRLFKGTLRLPEREYALFHRREICFARNRFEHEKTPLKIEGANVAGGRVNDKPCLEKSLQTKIKVVRLKRLSVRLSIRLLFSIPLMID
jgi:hypothetical protein